MGTTEECPGSRALLVVDTGSFSAAVESLDQGVALATLGGKLLAEAALGRTERFDVFARVPATAFPGGALLRKPLVSAALMWFKLMDSL